MSHASTRNGSGGKITFDPEHRYQITNNISQHVASIDVISDWPIVQKTDEEL